MQVNSELRSGYVEIEEAVLGQNRLTLKLNQEATRSIGLDDTIEIRLVVSSEQLTAIESACRRLFDKQRFRVA
jgi:hypothetical protein